MASGNPGYALHFEGGVARDSVLPAEALVQALEGLQRAVFLLGMAAEGYEVSQRARVSQAIQRRYAVICDLPRKGSYIQPYTIGSGPAGLFDPGLVAKVTADHVAVLEAVNSGDERHLRQIIPDSYYRRNVIHALRNMQPAERLGLIVSVETSAGSLLLNGTNAVAHLQNMSAALREPLIAPGVVSGILIEMRFQERQLRLQMAKNGKVISATYADDFEPVLLGNPRQIVQVRGDIIFGEDGVTPERIVQVDEILAIDSSPLVFQGINQGNLVLTAKGALEFKIDYSRELNLYEVDGPFGIYETADTRPDLERLLGEQIAFLWKEYVQVDEQELAPSGQMVRSELLAAFGEI